jgi:hypothetical protein
LVRKPDVGSVVDSECKTIEFCADGVFGIKKSLVLLNKGLEIPLYLV